MRARCARRAHEGRLASRSSTSSWCSRRSPRSSRRSSRSARRRPACSTRSSRPRRRTATRSASTTSRDRPTRRAGSADLRLHPREADDRRRRLLHDGLGEPREPQHDRRLGDQRDVGRAARRPRAPRRDPSRARAAAARAPRRGGRRASRRARRRGSSRVSIASREEGRDACAITISATRRRARSRRRVQDLACDYVDPEDGAEPLPPPSRALRLVSRVDCVRSARSGREFGPMPPDMMASGDRAPPPYPPASSPPSSSSHPSPRRPRPRRRSRRRAFVVAGAREARVGHGRQARREGGARRPQERPRTGTTAKLAPAAGSAAHRAGQERRLADRRSPRRRRAPRRRAVPAHLSRSTRARRSLGRRLARRPRRSRREERPQAVPRRGPLGRSPLEGTAAASSIVTPRTRAVATRTSAST